MRRIVSIIVLVLSACSGDLGFSGTAPDAAGVAPPVAKPIPHPRPAPAGNGAAATPSPSSGHDSVPLPKIKPAPVAKIDPEKLDGLDVVRLENIIGPADDVRSLSSGLVWAYKDSACTVEFYLYPEVSTVNFSVLGHKILPETLSPAERASCLERLAARIPKH